MAVLDHWHPVLLSRSLGRTPAAVKLAGRELAVFRTAAGVAALDDICPHRRMRLSLGRVIDNKLECKYHGWTFTADGQGESPGTPKLHACAAAFDAREAHGAVWVKARDAAAAFPTFDVAGYHPMGVMEHRVRAPLELTLDNFTEIEHTPTTHGLFGYPLERMHEVRVNFEPTPATVGVRNHGPSKAMPWWLKLLIGVNRADSFIDDWVTHFSPVYSVYDHEWGDRLTGRRGRIGWRLYIFFTPAAEAETLITTFAYVRSRYPGPAGGTRLMRWLMRHYLDAEIKADVRVLEDLASHDTSIAGMKLSRFDRTLGLNRERLASVYRGEVVS